MLPFYAQKFFSTKWPLKRDIIEIYYEQTNSITAHAQKKTTSHTYLIIVRNNVMCNHYIDFRTSHEQCREIVNTVQRSTN